MECYESMLLLDFWRVESGADGYDEARSQKVEKCNTM